MITIPLDSTYPILSFKTSAKGDCIRNKIVSSTADMGSSAAVDTFNALSSTADMGSSAAVACNEL